MLRSLITIPSQKYKGAQTSGGANIAYVQSDTGVSNSVTFTNTPVSGNTIVVVVVQYGGSLPTAGDISDNKGNTYLLAAQLQNVGEQPNISVFYKIAATSSATFTVSVATIPNYNRIFALEYSGVVSIDQTNSAEQDAQTFANGGAINPTTSDQLIIMASANDEPNQNTLTVTPSGAYTVRQLARDGFNESTGFVMDSVPEPTGSQTPQATLNHTLNSATVVVSFKNT